MNIDLSSKARLKRAQFVLDNTDDNKEIFSNARLDYICGQARGQFNRELRKCFRMLAIPIDKKNCQGYSFCTDPTKIKELALLVRDAERGML